MSREAAVGSDHYRNGFFVVVARAASEMPWKAKTFLLAFWASKSENFSVLKDQKVIRYILQPISKHINWWLSGVEAQLTIDVKRESLISISCPRLKPGAIKIKPLWGYS